MGKYQNRKSWLREVLLIIFVVFGTALIIAQFILNLTMK